MDGIDSQELFTHRSGTPLNYFFVFRLPRPPRSTLFPYTTLFRSRPHHPARARSVEGARSTRARAAQHQAADPLGRTQRQLLGSEEHTSELQSRRDLVCRLLLEKKNYITPLHSGDLTYVFVRFELG